MKFGHGSLRFPASELGITCYGFDNTTEQMHENHIHHLKFDRHQLIKSKLLSVLNSNAVVIGLKNLFLMHGLLLLTLQKI